jgi:ACDE family multidrug resistance protein
MVFGNAMLIPVFTQIQQALNISFFQVGLLITYYSIAASIFIPIFGFVSDYIKRKTVIIVAVSLYGLGGGIIAILSIFKGSESIFHLILASRVIQGIGAAGMSPIVIALVGDLFTSEERAKALGLIEASNIFGKVISPVLGALLALLVWFAPFFVYPVLALPVFFAIFFLITEPDNKKKTTFKKYFSDLKNIFTLRGKFLWISYLSAWTAFLILFGVLAFLSDALETRYGITGVLKGIVIAIPVSAWTISSFLSGFYLQKKTQYLKYFVMVGLLLLGVASLLIPFSQNIYFMLASVFLMGLGGGLVIPPLTILVTNCAPVEERGGIVSLYGSIRFFGVAVGPPLFSFLADFNSKIPFWSSGALTGSILIMFAFLNNQEVIKLCEKIKDG